MQNALSRAPVLPLPGVGIGEDEVQISKIGTSQAEEPGRNDIPTALNQEPNTPNTSPSRSPIARRLDNSTELETTGCQNIQGSCVPELSNQLLNDHLQNSSPSRPATPGSSEDRLNHCKLTALNQEHNTPNTSPSL